MVKKIIVKIRLLPKKRKESYFSFYKILGFIPGNIKLYEEALLHKSSSKETETGKYLNNERLEFLGDAILDSIVADLVFHKFKNKNEGFLTNTRSKIVQRDTLNRVANELQLNKLIVSSSRINAQKSHILGNALEALIGAIYLDKGYNTTKKFIRKKIIKPFIDIDSLARKEVNFKSKLLEWSQKQKVNIEFNLVENFNDEENNPVFQTQVALNNQMAGIGIGYSKKESQQNASKMALKKLKSDKDFINSILEAVKKNEENEPENPDNNNEESDNH